MSTYFTAANGSVMISGPTDTLVLNTTSLSLTGNGLISVGSNTQNVQINSTSVVIDGVAIYANNIVPVSLDFGIANTSNLIANSLSIVISTPTGNLSINATSIIINTAAGNVSINSTSIVMGNTTLNSTAIFANSINANVLSISGVSVATTMATETSRALAAEALLAPLTSPGLTGSPTAPTQTPLTNSTAIATTKYTDLAVAVETTRALAAEALLAPLASPGLTGNPTAPTQTHGDNSTKLATTAYHDTGVTDGSNAGAGQVGEFVSNTQTNVSLTSAVQKTVSTLTLTAGDWDVYGGGTLIPSNSFTVINYSYMVISTQTANVSAVLDYTGLGLATGIPIGSDPLGISGMRSRLNCTASNTLYLVAATIFSNNAAQVNAYCTFSARRVR